MRADPAPFAIERVLQRAHIELKHPRALSELSFTPDASRAFSRPTYPVNCRLPRPRS
jgi:hypothetical protein